MTTDRAPRRRHAAAASRVLVGGISVASTLGLTAHWAAAAPAESVAVEVAAPPAVAPAPQRIIIRRRIVRTEAAPAVATGTPDAAVAPAAAPPAPTPAPAAPAAAPAPAAPAAIPALPSAALAPPPAAAAPAPATSSAGS